MTRLGWSQPGDKYYRAGVDRGVIYDKSGIAEPWNGLVSVADTLDGGVTEPIYYNGLTVGYRDNSVSHGTSIQAYTYPDIVDQLQGYGITPGGVMVSNQSKSLFDLTYRSGVGNDLHPDDYILVILYDMVFNTLAKTSTTKSASVNPGMINLAAKALHRELAGYNDLTEISLDTRRVSRQALGIIEGFLYGGFDIDPSSLSPERVITFMDAWVEAQDLPRIFNLRGRMVEPVIDGYIYNNIKNPMVEQNFSVSVYGMSGMKQIKFKDIPLLHRSLTPVDLSRYIRVNPTGEALVSPVLGDDDFLQIRLDPGYRSSDVLVRTSSVIASNNIIRVRPQSSLYKDSLIDFPEARNTGMRIQNNTSDGWVTLLDKPFTPYPDVYSVEVPNMNEPVIRMELYQIEYDENNEDHLIFFIDRTFIVENTPGTVLVDGEYIPFSELPDGVYNSDVDRSYEPDETDGFISLTGFASEVLGMSCTYVNSSDSGSSDVIGISKNLESNIEAVKGGYKLSVTVDHISDSQAYVLLTTVDPSGLVDRSKQTVLKDPNSPVRLSVDIPTEHKSYLEIVRVDGLTEPGDVMLYSDLSTEATGASMIPGRNTRIGNQVLPVVWEGEPYESRPMAVVYDMSLLPIDNVMDGDSVYVAETNELLVYSNGAWSNIGVVPPP